MSDNPRDRTPRRRLTSLQLHMIAVIVFGGVGVFVGMTDGLSASPEIAAYRPWIIAVLVVGGLIFTTVWWRRLDEAAREAHKWAWFWGANLGAVVALAVLLAGSQGRALVARIGLDNSLEDGAAMVLLVQIVAYLLCWGLWWIRRR